jgi:hypothetical protein
LISAGKQRMFLKLQSKYSKTYVPLNAKYYLLKVTLIVHFFLINYGIIYFMRILAVAHESCAQRAERLLKLLPEAS